MNLETIFFRVRIIRGLAEVYRRFRGTSFLYCKCILTSQPAILIIALSYSIQFFISVLSSCFAFLFCLQPYTGGPFGAYKVSSLSSGPFFSHFILFFGLPLKLVQPHLPRHCAPSFYNYPDDRVSSFF